MGQRLHGRARTTAALRRAIQQSQESLAELAKRMASPPSAQKRGTRKTQSRFQGSLPSPSVPPLNTPRSLPLNAPPARPHCGAPRVDVGAR
jgi:hypothetical protein